MAAALVNGWLLDRLLGDPRRGHPVAGFGRIAAALERLLWRPSRAAGVLYAAVLVGGAALATAAADRGLRARPYARLAWRSLVVWATLGGRSLERIALRVAGQVADGDLFAARALAPALVGRDPSQLGGPELCRAALESVAENAGDAVVAPLLWGALLGAPGAAAYRALNTLDAMVGHGSERHREFGWAAARGDDLANWPAARLTALLAVTLAPLVGGRPAAAWRAAFTGGARRHPSPNAGRIEGAYAGALSVRLGGANRYSYGTQVRPTLGSGRPPTPRDVVRAVRLTRLTSTVALAVCAAHSWRIER
jgi:adenosylcobinamide-phosphate synthase